MRKNCPMLLASRRSLFAFSATSTVTSLLVLALLPGVRMLGGVGTEVATKLGFGIAFGLRSLLTRMQWLT